MPRSGWQPAPRNRRSPLDASSVAAGMSQTNAGIPISDVTSQRRIGIRAVSYNSSRWGPHTPKPLTDEQRNVSLIRGHADGDCNPDSIEPRHIAQTGDADLPRLGRNASQRVIRRDRPMRSTLKHLQNRAVETLGQAGDIWTLHGRKLCSRDKIALL